MNAYVTDTHALIWYLQENQKLSRKVKTIFESCDNGETIVYIPVICLIEFVYLYEKRKIPFQLYEELENIFLSGDTNFIIVDINLDVVKHLRTIARDNIPDLPDRIIAATALFKNLPLISRDRMITHSKIETIW